MKKKRFFVVHTEWGGRRKIRRTLDGFVIFQNLGSGILNIGETTPQLGGGRWNKAIGRPSEKNMVRD